MSVVVFMCNILLDLKPEVACVVDAMMQQACYTIGTRVYFVSRALPAVLVHRLSCVWCVYEELHTLNNFRDITPLV